MIAAQRIHPGLGLILDAQYEEPMTPLRPALGGGGLGWVTVDSGPLNPNPPTGRPPIPYFQHGGGLGYYAVDSNPLQGVFDSTLAKIALALGLAAGVGGGVMLYRRRSKRRR